MGARLDRVLAFFGFRELPAVGPASLWQGPPLPDLTVVAPPPLPEHRVPKLTRLPTARTPSKAKPKRPRSKEKKP
jgi:hypothetical protein